MNDETSRRGTCASELSLLHAGVRLRLTRNRFGWKLIGQITSLVTACVFAATMQATTRATRIDFDGDGKTDMAVFRSSTAYWYVLQSHNPQGAQLQQQYGALTDIPVPGDYDGDGNTDFAVFRPSNATWYLSPSSGRGAQIQQQFGGIGDIPVPGDYDGDGKMDVAVFRPTNATWFIVLSSTGQQIQTQWGSPTDIPVPGDYDGDGKTDVAVFRPSTATWYVVQSSNPSGPILQQQYGEAGVDIPVPGDYDGDRKTDFAVFRPTSAVWYVLLSGSGSQISPQWGGPGDIPVPGDYDGDGKTDVAVFRPSTAMWYAVQSSNPGGPPLIQQYGGLGDLPLSTRVPAVAITGQVSAGGTPLDSATVSLSGTSSRSTTTDTNGNYSFLVSSEGTYTLTASLYDFSFSPGSATFTNINANQSANFSAAQVIDNGIEYHGGPVILGTTNIYYIWYGNWTGETAISILENFAGHIGGSPYFNVAATYFNGQGNRVSNSVAFVGAAFDFYSRGWSLTDSASNSDVVGIVENAISNGSLPLDANAVYFVLTAADVKESQPQGAFCRDYSGWHGDTVFRGQDIKIAFVGDPWLQCPLLQPQPYSSPNNNTGADSMAMTIGHELSEAVTDPNENGWYHADASRPGQPQEMADKCEGTYGQTYKTANGSLANVNLNGYNYLLQQLWVNVNGGYCALSF